MIVYQGQPGTSSSALYTSDRLFSAFSVTIANTTGTAATARLNVCRAGAAAAATNRVIADAQVEGGQTVIFEFPITLVAGDILRGLQGTSSALTYTIDGTPG